MTVDQMEEMLTEQEKRGWKIKIQSFEGKWHFLQYASSIRGSFSGEPPGSPTPASRVKWPRLASSSPGSHPEYWVMPEIDGIELCRRIRERQGPYQYILLVTGKDDKQDVVRGLEAGADDYLTKPFDRNELRARLRVGRRILTLQQDLINAREELRFQATHDLLTGIWNRGAVLDLLHRELERAARAQTPTSVLMLDLDHFKRINDTHGHLTGDVVLREVATRIVQSVRSYDLVGRYGGEEFLVVLPVCEKTEIERSANRIRLAIASAPILTASSEIPVTASIGATVIAAGSGLDKESLLAADRALYQAKNSGRNRVSVL